MANKKLKISLILPTYNGEKYLDLCLKSVLGVSYLFDELIMVDDASEDKSNEIFAKYKMTDKRIKVIKSKINRGAAWAKNRGAKEAKGDIFVFMDNDIRIPKNWLDSLLAPLIKEPGLAATQSIIMDYDDSDLIQQAGGMINPFTGWLKGICANEKYSQMKKKGKITQRAVVGVSGALAVRREFFKKVKGFDEKEARHSEDIDFSWRLWVSGAQINVIPKSFVYHKNKPMKERALMNANSEYIHFHLVRNSIRSMLKNYELLNMFKYLTVFILLNIGRIIFAIFKFNPSIIKGTLRAFLWNVIHISDTMSARKLVQKSRKLTDSEIMEKVFIKENLLDLLKYV